MNIIAMIICIVVIPTILFSIYVIYSNKSSANSETEKVEKTEPKHTIHVQPKTQGRVFGTIGTLYMAGYAVYINETIRSANVTNLGEAIGKAAAINLFGPFFYAVAAAALLGFIGAVSKNKLCILLALAATIGAFLLLPGAIKMLILPAILFLISYIRMAK